MSAGSSLRRKMKRLQNEDTRLRPHGKEAFKKMANGCVLIGYAPSKFNIQGDPLMYYSTPENDNIWNYYRLSDREEDNDRYVWDARRHDPLHEFDGARNPVDIIKDILFTCEGRQLNPNEFYKKPSELVQKQDELFGIVNLTYDEKDSKGNNESAFKEDTEFHTDQKTSNQINGSSREGVHRRARRRNPRASV